MDDKRARNCINYTKLNRIYKRLWHSFQLDDSHKLREIQIVSRVRLALNCVCLCMFTILLLIEQRCKNLFEIDRNILERSQ